MTIYTYDQPLGYRLEILSRDGLTSHYVFDSLKQQEGETQPIGIQDMHINLNSSMSHIDFSIENSAKDVDGTKIKAGALMKLQYGKHTDFWANPKSYCFVGYLDFPNISRPGTDANEIKVIGVEAKQGFYDTKMNVRRSSPLSDLTNPDSQKSKEFTVKGHLEKILTQRKHTVLDDVSLQNRFGFTYGISSALDTIIPNIVYNYENAGSIYDDLLTKVGGIWGVDYTGGLKKVFADYAVNKKTPIVIKNGPKPVPMSDNPNRTAYTAEGFDINSSSQTSSGYASRLFGLTRIDKHVVASSTVTSHQTSLTNKAIYQPFTTNEVRFNGLDFTVRMRGEVSSPLNRLNGGIYINKVVSGVNQPDTRLMEWHVPLDEIEDEKTNVHVELDDIRTRFIDANITFGIAWGQRSGTDEEDKGDPNNDEDNTIMLYRDNSSTGGSSVAAGGRLDSKLTWKANGPKYAHSVTSSLNRVFAVTNYTAVEAVGFKEPDVVDLNVVSDSKLALRHLGNILFVSSLYKGEPRLTVTCPDDHVFLPYQSCNFVDYLSHPTGMSFEIHEVDITFNDNTNDVSLAGVVFLDDAWPTAWPCRQVI